MIREGYAIKEDLEEHQEMTKVDLLGKLYTGEAYERTIAVRLIMKKEGMTMENAERFLLLLETEAAFYSQMELFNALSKISVREAEMVASYLGNFRQTKRNPLEEFFPPRERRHLPKDVAGCVLIKAGDVSINPLMGKLTNANGTQKEAAMDTLLYICGYDKISKTKELEKLILNLLKEEEMDVSVRIKLVKMMDAFDSNEVLTKLMEMKWKEKSPQVKVEVGKSLLNIYNRSKRRAI